MIRMENKVTLITGGSRGIGRAAAEMFAEAGSRVAINYQRDEAAARDAQAACEQHGVKALTIKSNVADKAQVDRMMQTVIDEFGRIDVVVNNAGVWIHNPIDEMTEDRLRETVDINLLGTFYVCMAAAPHMKRQKSGVMVNVSSTAGQRGEAFHSPYAATKAGVIGLTKSLAPELAEFGIRVNCVAPGWVETDMSTDALQGDGRDKVCAQIPLRRVGRPEELAGPILFVASDLATFITGEVLNVNGGAVLCG